MKATTLLLPTNQTLEKTGDSRSRLYYRIQIGLFPRPVKDGTKKSLWPESEVELINAAIVAGKTDSEIRELVKLLEAKRVHALDEALAKMNSGVAA